MASPSSSLSVPVLHTNRIKVHEKTTCISGNSILAIVNGPGASIKIEESS